jgi:hypothetical protein
MKATNQLLLLDVHEDIVEKDGVEVNEVCVDRETCYNDTCSKEDIAVVCIIVWIIREPRVPPFTMLCVSIKYLDSGRIRPINRGYLLEKNATGLCSLLACTETNRRHGARHFNSIVIIVEHSNISLVF